MSPGPCCAGTGEDAGRRSVAAPRGRAGDRRSAIRDRPRDGVLPRARKRNILRARPSSARPSMSLSPPRPSLPSLNALRAFERPPATRASSARRTNSASPRPRSRSRSARWRTGSASRCFTGRRGACSSRARPGRCCRAWSRRSMPWPARRTSSVGMPIARRSRSRPSRAWRSCGSRPVSGRCARRSRTSHFGGRAGESPRLRPGPFRFRRLFFADADFPHCSTQTLVEDELFPVCAPQLLADREGSLDLAGLADMTLLHDARWRNDWARWLRHAGDSRSTPAADRPSRSTAWPWRRRSRRPQS